MIINIIIVNSHNSNPTTTTNNNNTNSNNHNENDNKGCLLHVPVKDIAGRGHQAAHVLGLALSVVDGLAVGAGVVLS